MSLLAEDQQLARRVGAVGLGVIALAIGFFVFVYDRIEWGRHMRVRVYFHATGGLTEGAPGPLNGDEGVVAKIAIDEDAAEQLVRGDVFVASKGPLSARYLELGPAEDGSRVALHEGDQLLGRDPPTLDRVFQRTWDNLTTLGGFLDELRPEMAALREQLTKLQATMKEVAPDVSLRDDVDALVSEAGRTYDDLGGRPGIDRIDAMMDHARKTIAQARAMIAALRPRIDALSASVDVLRARLGTKGREAIDKVQLAIDNTKATIAKLDPLLAQVDELRGRIERGEGSLLKLMNDPEFPEDAKELGKILKRQPWKIMDHP